MNELHAIKKQSTAYLPVAHWVKSGVLPFLVSLSLHLGIAVGVGLMLHNAYDKSGGGNTDAKKPVYVTLVRETSARVNISEAAEPLKINKPQKEERTNIKDQKQDIITELGKGSVQLPQENRQGKENSDQENKNTAKRINQADKATAPSHQIATTAQAPYGSRRSQTVYSGGSGRAEVKYQDQVRAVIHANRIYPRQARRLKMEGESVVRLEVMRDGHIKSYRFIKSTGYDVLDQAVEDIIKSSNPLPNVPASIQKVPVIINLPLGFKLQQ